MKKKNKTKKIRTACTGGKSSCISACAQTRGCVRACVCVHIEATLQRTAGRGSDATRKKIKLSFSRNWKVAFCNFRFAMTR